MEVLQLMRLEHLKARNHPLFVGGLVEACCNLLQQLKALLLTLFCGDPLHLSGGVATCCSTISSILPDELQHKTPLELGVRIKAVFPLALPEQVYT